jgi:peptidoglycan hydrolase CwlO-like protein
MKLEEIAAKIKARVWINHEEMLFVLERYEQLDDAAQKLVRELAELRKYIDSLEAKLETMNKQHQADQEDIHRLENRIDSMWGIWGDAGKGRHVHLG